jgi:hypothetical protein
LKITRGGESDQGKEVLVAFSTPMENDGLLLSPSSPTDLTGTGGDKPSKAPIQLRRLGELRRVVRLRVHSLFTSTCKLLEDLTALAGTL